jgi:hypothetical protein
VAFGEFPRSGTVAESQQLIREWDVRMEARKAEIAALAEESDDEPIEPGGDDRADLPDGYEKVRRLVDSGELDWISLTTGDVSAEAMDDPDVRSVHLWLLSILDEGRQLLSERAGG